MYSTTVARLLVPGDIIVVGFKREFTVTDVYYPDVIRRSKQLIVEADGPGGKSESFDVLPDTRFTIKGH